MATLVVRNGYPSARRSVRRGGRVTSEYVGSGMIASAAVFIDREARARREAAREASRAATAAIDDEWREVDEALDRIASEARAAATGAIEAAGYRLHHRGEWRKARG